MAWLLTHTRKRFDPFNLDSAVYCIEDIAHALSNICRFNGHCSSFYSVAQHSVYVADRARELDLDREGQLAALLHDASEAYLSDVIRPMKVHDLFEFYRVIEEQVQGGIHKALLGSYYLPEYVEAVIPLADMSVLGAEARDLMGDPQDWDLKVAPWKKRIIPMQPVNAETFFLQKYEELHVR